MVGKENIKEFGKEYTELKIGRKGNNETKHTMHDPPFKAKTP